MIRERTFLAALLSLIFLISPIYPSVTFSIADSTLKFYVFTDPHCQSCVDAIRPLLAMYYDRVVVYDVREPHNAERFYKIFTAIDKMVSTPLVGIFEDGELVAIVSGYHSKEDWERIVEAEYDGIPVYLGTSSTPFKILREQKVANSIANLFIDNEQEGNSIGQEPAIDTNLYRFLPLILTAAAVDAINPCEFYILIVFLSLVFFRVGRKAVLKAGIAFSIAIFVIYYLMGLGLLRLITYAKEARILILILGFSMGLRAVLNFIFGLLGLSIGLRDIIGGLLNRKFKRVPEAFSKRLSVYLRRVSENPLIAFAIGVLSSAFLLPCTSGPYFVALGLIANLETLVDGLLLLTVYNSIIMVPFLVVTFGVYTLKLKTSELKKWSSRKQRWLNLIAENRNELFSEIKRSSRVVQLIERTFCWFYRLEQL